MTRIDIMPNFFSKVASQNGVIKLFSGGHQIKSLVPLLDVARLLHNKSISPVELTQQMLRRIKTKDRKLKSYALVTPELAIRQAKKAEREIANGKVRGPLHGVPIAVKDLCFTRGIPTAAGMSINKNFKPKFERVKARS